MSERRPTTIVMPLRLGFADAFHLAVSPDSRLELCEDAEHLKEGSSGRRAESLDCVVYSMAVRHLVTANLDRREKEVVSRTMSKKAAVVVKSAWLNR